MAVVIGLIALGIGLGSSLFLPVPQSLKTNFDAGQSLYALGEYEGAIIEYSKIVRFNSRAVRTDSVRINFESGLELPVVAAAWYKLGDAYKESSQHEKAIEAYKKVTVMDIVDEDFRSIVQLRVGETRFKQKEFQEAANEYRHYVNLFPTSSDAAMAQYYAGWSEFNLQQYDKAIQSLSVVLENYPDDRYAADAQFRIASSYYEKGEYEKAVAQSEATLEQHPGSFVIGEATYLKAQAYDRMGRSQDAIGMYREVRDLYEHMWSLLQGSLREGKNVDFDRYMQLFETSSLRVAEIYRGQEKYQEAYEELIVAQETAEERFSKAKVQMRMGDNFLAWKRFDDAWAAYNQVIELYGDTPFPPNAQYQKGETRYFEGDYGRAREDYRLVPANYPDSETALRAASLYSAGQSAEKLEDFDSALELYDDVVDNFPRSTEAPLCLLRIGQINSEQKLVDEALVAYRRVATDYGETQYAADANYWLGILYKDQGQLDEAVDSFSKVGREAREIYVHSLVQAANIHIGAGRPEQARGVLTQMLVDVEGDRDLEATAHYQIAKLDLNNKNYADAVRGYTKVIENYPESETIRDAVYERGLAYHYTGYYSNALGDYQRLLDSDIAAAMRLKVEFAMALSHAAEGDDAKATVLLNRVIDSGDETLARNAQLQLISMAEKQDPADAIRTYEGMLTRVEAEEDKVRVLVRLASAYFRLGQYDRSIEASQRLVDLAVDVESISNALFVQGNSYFRAGDMDQAIATYQKIIDDYPQIGWAKNAQFQIGISLHKLSGGGGIAYLPKLSEAFQTYYERYPDDEQAVYAYYYDAWARYRMGKWREASETFEELVRQFPGSNYAPESLYRAGEAVFNIATGRSHEQKIPIFREATKKYEAVIASYPKSDYVDDALYNTAWALIHLDRKEDALPIFEQIVAEHRDGRYGARSQFTLGDYYYGEKVYDKATESYEQFLAMYQDADLKAEDKGLRRKATILLGHLSEIDAYNIYAEGEKLFDAKDFEEAIRIFKEVQTKYPDSDQTVNAAVNIGAAYMALEDYRKAAAEFQKVVDQYSGEARFSPQVDFAKQQLEVMAEARVI